jgi:SAM-dependent methyltransferase
MAKDPPINYGNWVSTHLIIVPGAIGAILLLASVPWRILIIPAIAFLLMAGYFAYAHYLFAPGGKDVQGSIWSALVDHIDWDGRGKALDIGCGSGALSIRLAKKYPGATVTGIDQWGRQWEYSKTICERNATIEGVGDRIVFQQASASRLPFQDESFDLVVSNLTFHEVKDAPDKRMLLKEAFRVLRKGGCFAFQDLFLLKRTYGEIDALLSNIKGWGVTRAEFIDTHSAPFIPLALRLPFMVGTLGLFTGVK